MFSRSRIVDMQYNTAVLFDTSTIYACLAELSALPYFEPFSANRFFVLSSPLFVDGVVCSLHDVIMQSPSAGMCMCVCARALPQRRHNRSPPEMSG